MEIVPNINKILGEGEYAVVFEGTCNDPRKVAVKRVLLKDVQTNFEEESALKKLKHSNVVRLFQVENDHEYKYYALELCSASLDKLFLKDEDDKKYRGPVPSDVEILYQLASGLNYIHKNELVHNDLKPQNAFICLEEYSGQLCSVIKWSDFGLSKQGNGKCRIWLAPEMHGTELNRPKGTYKSDIFAEGLTFAYTLLKGEHVYDNDIPVVEEDGMREQNAVNLEKIAESHGRMFELIQKMLNFDPSERLEAQNVVERLETIKQSIHLKIFCDRNKMIGEGGFAKVFEGNWGPSWIKVAVKRIEKAKINTNTDKEKERAKREETAMLTLEHRNVIKFYCVEETEDFRYYALELCAGSLDELYSEESDIKEKIITIPSTKEIIIQLATGLEYIHDKKLIHRDLKPKNALIWIGASDGKDGNRKNVVMKWADFGLSKRTSPTGSYSISEVNGTLKWLAPEIFEMWNNQKKGKYKKGTFMSDIFSEGLTFAYILLGGVHPDEDKIQANRLKYLSNRKSINLKNILDETLRKLIGRMLKMNPAERLSAKQVVEKLRETFSRTESLETAFNKLKIGNEVAKRAMKRKTQNPMSFTTDMVAFGRRFQLGSLYDYRTDNILTAGFFHGLTSSEEQKYNLLIEFSSEDPDNKFAIMGLDEHLQMSTMVGLISNYRGASSYLNEKINASKTSQILVLRLISKKERLILKNITAQQVLRLVEEAKATHVVVGVTYGAEAYCVLTQDLHDDKLSDEEAREEARDEARKNLSVVGSKLVKALEEQQNADDFQLGLGEEEKQILTRMKCRIYADNQIQAVRECSVIDAYNHCMKLIEKIRNSNEGREIQSVPISLSLCPLKRLVGKVKDAAKLLKYRDVDSGLVSRCCHIFMELERISDKATDLRATINRNSRTPLRQFVETIEKFQIFLKKDLKVAVVKARESDDDDEQVANIIEVAERHPLFKPSRLERWLKYKKSESDMLEKINEKTTGIAQFINERLLANVLVNSEKKFTLALSISSMDKWTKDFLDEMKSCTKRNKLIFIKDSDEDSQEKGAETISLPWHTDVFKRKQMLFKIREFANHVEYNKHLEDRVQFLVVMRQCIGDIGKGLCRYFLYEHDNILKENIDLPRSPTGLKITEKTSSSFQIEWDHKALGYPVLYLVEYRLKNDSDLSWIQQRTTKPGKHQMVINFLKDGETMEIRVATDTCIGRSEFSDAISTNSEFKDDDASSRSSQDNISDATDESESLAMDPRPTSVRLLQTRTTRIMNPLNSQEVEKEKNVPTTKNFLEAASSRANTVIELDGCVKMAALGRKFKLGSMYDYRRDRVTNDNWLDIQSSITAHTINEEFRLKMNIINTETGSNIWEFIGLDDHLKTSVMTGLIENYNGAIKYLKSITSFAQATRMLVVRAVSRKESLHMENIVDYEIVKLKVRNSSTHVVAGVTYGAEVYCVLTHNLDKELDEEEAREVANENLYDMATTLMNALHNNHDFDYFLSHFNEKEIENMNRTKCLLYTNHQMQATECNFFDAYRHCLKVIDQVTTTDYEENQSVPISVFLCPLNRIINPTEEIGKLFQYRDVDSNMVTRCCRIWAVLKRVRAEAVILHITNSQMYLYSSLRQFALATKKFQNLLRESLKIAVVQARETADSDDKEIMKILDNVETLSFFKPSGLKRWLDYKNSELKIAEKIRKTKGITFFTSKMELKNNLKFSPIGKYALVMWVPSLDSKTNVIVNAMTSYVNQHQTKLVPAFFYKDVGSEELPWHMDDGKQKLINEKIRQFVDYVSKIETTGKKAYFFIASDENSEKLSCHYSVYNDDTVLKDNLEKLPGPPTNLRTLLPIGKVESPIRKSPTVQVSWEYDDLDYPCHFFVEYRMKGTDECWYQQKTARMGERQLLLFINVEPGSCIEIRVAADTIIGRSEHSNTTDVEWAPVDEDDRDDDVFQDLEENSSQSPSFKSIGNRSQSELSANG